MSTERISAVHITIIVLLVLNLGVSAYIALRPSPAATAGEAVTSAVTTREADQLAKTVIALYNAKDMPGLYELFDPLAKAQFSQQRLGEQMDRLVTVIGRIDSCAYSHATVAGSEGGRTYYTLNFKARLSGGAFPTGDMTLTVSRSGEKLSLFGFFVNGTSRTQ